MLLAFMTRYTCPCCRLAVPVQVYYQTHLSPEERSVYYRGRHTVPRLMWLYTGCGGLKTKDTYRGSRTEQRSWDETLHGLSLPLPRI